VKAINAYLDFDGTCKQAMEFYKQCLGGELMMHPWSAGPEEFSKGVDPNRIMHASLHTSAGILMAADVPPGSPYLPPAGFSICIAPDTREETAKLFSALSAGGEVTFPLQDTFWGAHFGTLKDKFGVQWMLNFENPKS
jgi:PhnB protein